MNGFKRIKHVSHRWCWYCLHTGSCDIQPSPFGLLKTPKLKQVHFGRVMIVNECIANTHALPSWYASKSVVYFPVSFSVDHLPNSFKFFRFGHPNALTSSNARCCYQNLSSSGQIELSLYPICRILIQKLQQDLLHHKIYYLCYFDPLSLRRDHNLSSLSFSILTSAKQCEIRTIICFLIGNKDILKKMTRNW